MLLAGDIGGTKTVLAVFAPGDPGASPLLQERFPSDEYDSLEEVILDFESHFDYPITHATFGVAGPVVSGRAQITNLPWVIDEKNLASTLNLRSVKLLNDLESLALAIPHLKESDLEVLNPGSPVPGGTIGVVAPGTGLGEAFLVWDGQRYRAHPSEGGHTDFGPSNDLEWELLRYMREVVGKPHVSYEHVCSGLGIPNIYDFLRHSGYAPEPTWLTRELEAAEDRTPVIVRAALDIESACDLCHKTLDIFVGILAAEAGNLALTVLATGGVYLGGGIPPRILPKLREQSFFDAFIDKGRFRNLLKQVPLAVILHPQAPLLGAASYGLALMQQPE